MGVEIDWSKAPEGTVGALVAKPDNVHFPEVSFVAWAKRVGCGIRAVSSEDYRALHGIADSWDFVERPAEPWTGEGLPPVGMECEVKNDINDGWDRVDEVLAHTTIKGAVVAVFKRDDRVFYSPADAFRALRTPEQIAAEEREKAIDEIATILDGLWSSEREAAGFLYDAGYRKVTP
ncbi:hypothetical protein [Stutzerimonas nitrititolerans]|uniref:hypothetical protein n=1 Tax=Stutzerimonas nitrititolerans TaxID=2482751 RepID=UPI0028A6C6E1|nr:hypothetical protein [Stutzerimonas nitrititolerans]